MKGKIPSEILKLQPVDASYKDSGVSISPTLINFFFGNNGTGKSTIGKSIKEDSGTTWKIGKSATDYDVKVYNQAYIDANFRNYYNLPGVFTVNEVNIAIYEQAGKKRNEVARYEEEWLAARNAFAHKKDELDEILAMFQKKCWEITATLRHDFEKTQAKCKTKQNFANKVLSIKNPCEHDLGKLSRMYETAYSDSAKKYEKFAQISSISVLETVEGKEILSTAITNAGNTPFAQFMQALNATEWVQQGYSQIHANAGGKCPYCQQRLPNNFEDEIRAAFDAQYQQAIQQLTVFYEAYRQEANNLIVPLQKVPEDLLPGIDIRVYNDKLSTIKGIISSNIQLIKNKLETPSTIIELESLDNHLQELTDIIDGYNGLIEENNTIIDARQQSQIECTTAVWEHIAWLLLDEISQYESSKKIAESEQKKSWAQSCELDEKIAVLNREISELNKNCVNTKATMDSINILLRDSGFQNFSIHERTDEPNVYMILRQNGEVAENLSEGERNFIAFLYFYHQVKGTDSSDGVQRNKIVVIDDPVSSMDSSSLFIVSSLVRELIAICENNAIGGRSAIRDNYIKQIFVLTHNAYFHREVSYNQVKNYQYVNLYLISKLDDKSNIRLCVRTNPDIMTEEINYNPVQNSYAALWGEYKALDSTIPLMNVIRRILEYYFLQLCGYDGVTLRTRILKDNKERFIIKDENGNDNYAKFQMANAMLSYICTSSSGVNDGVNFIDDCIDVTQAKETFEQIFYLMNQEQHYNMMMGNK